MLSFFPPQKTFRLPYRFIHVLVTFIIHQRKMTLLAVSFSHIAILLFVTDLLIEWHKEMAKQLFVVRSLKQNFWTQCIEGNCNYRRRPF